MLWIADNTNIRWIKVFHLYKGFNKKYTKIGFFIKGSARIVEPPRIEYKGFRYKYYVKGDICRAFLNRSNLKENYKDGSSVLIKGNSCIIIKKKTRP